MTEAKIAFILPILIAPDIHEDASHKPQKMYIVWTH